MTDKTLLPFKVFSNLTGIPLSTLRYYDEVGLFTPYSRDKNNRRLYAPFQIVTLKFILVMVKLGFSISEIKEVGCTRTPQRIRDLLMLREDDIDRKMHEIMTIYSIIHTLRINISDGLSAKDGDMRIADIGETAIVLGDKNDFTGKESFYEEFVRFCANASHIRIDLSYPIGGYYTDAESFASDSDRKSVV